MAVMAGKNGKIMIGESQIGYIDNFSINVNQGTAETSQIGKQWREYISTCSDWSGSMSGTLDYGNPAQKAIVDELATPTDTPVSCEFKVGPDLTYTGTIVISSLSITGSFADKVAASINFQGTGALAIKASQGQQSLQGNSDSGDGV